MTDCMDWKSSLEALKDSLPEGEEVTGNVDDAGKPLSQTQPRLDVVARRAAGNTDSGRQTPTGA